jgi:hypothetical protein
MRYRTAVFGCALAIASALSLGSAAKADGVYKPARAHAYGPTFSRVLCTPPPSRWGGAPATWICSAGQKCCYDFVFRSGTCVAASDRCL